ncbi:MAG: CehA/McbA family metallohydrolase [Myxococcota bacterium]
MMWSLLACGQGEPVPPSPEPPSAPETPAFRGRPEVTADLVADRDAVRHASDGGGRVTLVNDPGRLEVAGPGRFELRFEVGPLGIADGGAVVFQSPPFWGWSSPQLEDPAVPGFTTVHLPDGLVSEPFVADQGTLVVPVRGRALRSGEALTVVYGDGVGARVDRFADAAQPLWFAVDGDGDGVRAWVSDPPTVAVHAGPPVRLHCVIPTTLAPDAPYTLHLSLLDAVGNPAEAALDVMLAGPGLPLEVRVEGTATVTGRAPAGVHRIRGFAGELGCLSNPMVVRDGAPRVQWMDLQVHTGVSDGTGTPEDAYRYGRDVAGLDGMALTDHDHWGMRFLDSDPERWASLVALADAWNRDDFVVVPAWEWTSWTYGHRHVLLFGDDRTLRSALDPATDTPAALQQAVRDAVIVPHHPAGGAVAVDWDHHPVKDGLVELCSVHGSSEAPDTPGPIYDPVDGSWVRQALDRGFRLGFVCSTDGHDGHPGLSQIAGPHGGLAAILDAGPGRDGLREALEARRTYATNGPRILLRFDVDGAPMGSVVPPGDHQATVRVVGEGDLATIELIRAGEIVSSVRPGAGAAHHAFDLPDLQPGEYAYVRVVQQDGGAAWSSPIFVGNAP